MIKGSIALVVLAACGGSSPPPKKADPQPLQRTRIPIEEPEEDEGPQDGVQIQSTKGRMELATIVAGIEPHKQTLMDCYMSRVGKRKWLGGRVSLHWDINKAGEITSVKLAESEDGPVAVKGAAGARKSPSGGASPSPISEAALPGGAISA